jgi:triacylglycerol lipase
MKRFRRAVAALGVAVMAVAGAAVAQSSMSSAAAEVSNGKNPVIFVHGFSRDGSDWDTMREAFLDSGYTEDQLVAISYNTYSQSNVKTAEIIGQQVEETLASTGAAEVDVVSHSMGSLNTRYCVKFDACAGKVGQWVSLAGANQSTELARLCHLVTCREMVPGSEVLSKLNSGAALPADTEGTVFWTRQDRIIVPATNSVLDGLDNIEVSGVTHTNIMRDANVIDGVLKVLGS